MRQVYIYHYPEGDELEVYGSASRAFEKAKQLADCIGCPIEGSVDHLRRGRTVCVADHEIVATIYSANLQ